MTDVQITCTPRDGIYRVSAETIAALDLLGVTLARQPGWRIAVQIPGALLSARPHTDNDPEEAAA